MVPAYTASVVALTYLIMVSMAYWALHPQPHILLLLLHDMHWLNGLHHHAASSIVPAFIIPDIGSSQAFAKTS